MLNLKNFMTYVIPLFAKEFKQVVYWEGVVHLAERWLRACAARFPRPREGLFLWMGGLTTDCPLLATQAASFPGFPP